MENRQTPVEWLMEQVNSSEYQRAFGQTYVSIELIEQAKEMEKERLYESFKAGWMRANAMNFEDSYFEFFYNELKGNN